MKRILLAVDGPEPNASTLHYALDLCRPVQADLDVLQIIRLGRVASGVDRFYSAVLHLRNRFETTMVDITLAEAGYPTLERRLADKAKKRFSRLLPPKLKTSVDYHCVLTRKNPDAVLMSYVRGHRHVVMAIYDTLRNVCGQPSASAAKRTALQRRLKRLSVPLVCVRQRN